MKIFLAAIACVFLGMLLLGADGDHPATASAPIVPGAIYQSAKGANLRMLMTQEMLGGAEFEIGEITFPPNLDSGDHVHGATETFYILEGELEHVVNGGSLMLKPGMIGTVRPPDKVRHKTGPAGARALVIWAPAGEAARFASRSKRIDRP